MFGNVMFNRDCKHHEGVVGYDLSTQTGQCVVPACKNEERLKAGKIANPKITT